MKINKLLLPLFLLIPYILVFKQFFLPGHLVWGDAPFFYPENLRQLFDWPLLWNYKNENFGAPQSALLWLYLPTYLYGLLHHLFNWNNDFLIRAVFYFPATLLSLIGSWIFLKRYIKNPYALLGGVLIYSFNTYFLTVIDGGVVGLALAYGLFPFAVNYILEFLEKGGISKFILALIFSVLITNTDLRLAILAWLLAPILYAKFKNIWYLAILFLSTILIDSFWVIPLFQNSQGYATGMFINNSFLNLLNALVLYSPHFPDNNFGKTTLMPFYFCFLLYLLFGSLVVKEKKRFFLALSILYLVFAFLVKGSSDPLGSLYSLIVNLPLGVAFRDSTKFFAPLALVGGVLVASTLEIIAFRFNKKIFYSVFLAVYLYLLLLIYPAVFGQMSGILGKNTQDADYVFISKIIQNNTQFFRTLWITEKPQLAYADWQHPALSSNALYKERPFASMNIGKFDLDNFIYDANFPKWLDLLGIKYLFLTGNIRSKNLTGEELKRQETILSWMEKNKGLEKLNWPVGFPAFKTVDTKPRFFIQDKLILVLGGEDIYDSLFKLPNFSLANQGFVFLEDGRIKPRDFENLPKDAIKIVLHKKSNQDLAMFFLQDKYVSTREAIKSQWIRRESQDYLTWKYDLLLNHIESKEFDYQQGISFSTIAKEEMLFEQNIKDSGKYYLALRYTNSSNSAGIKIGFNDEEKTIFNQEPESFKWDVIGPYELSKGIQKIRITNLGGFALVNAVILVSDKEFEVAQKHAADLLNNIEVIQIASENDYGKVLTSIPSYTPLAFKQVNPTEYQLEFPRQGKWLVFSEHFNNDWKIVGHQNFVSLPFYSMINGFYVGNISDQQIVLRYDQQAKMNKWVILSTVSVVIIVSVAGILYWKEKKR